MFCTFIHVYSYFKNLHTHTHQVALSGLVLRSDPPASPATETPTPENDDVRPVRNAAPRWGKPWEYQRRN